MKRWAVLGIGVLLGVAVALPAEAATTNVSIVSASTGFSPSSVTITVGDTVKWTNNDPTTTHTVTSSDSPPFFDSGNIGPGGTFSHTFNSLGSFAYHCSIHSNMTGSVIVQPAATTSTSRPATTTTSTTRPSTTTSSSLKPTTTSSSTSSSSTSSTTETTEPDTTTTESTTTTTDLVANPAKHKGGGSGAAAALIVLILFVAGVGGFAVYRLRLGR